MLELFLDEPDVHEWTEERRFYGADQPIAFSRYLDITGDKDYLELVDGVLVEKMLMGGSSLSVLIEGLLTAAY